MLKTIYVFKIFIKGLEKNNIKGDTQQIETHRNSMEASAQRADALKIPHTADKASPDRCG